MKTILYFLKNTIIYNSWLAFDGFLFQLLDTYTDHKSYRLLSILLRISWRNSLVLFTFQTYLFDIHFKITRYENVKIYFSISILQWNKDFILLRGNNEEDK